jgi:hypothetical protein
LTILTTLPACRRRLNNMDHTSSQRTAEQFPGAFCAGKR